MLDDAQESSRHSEKGTKVSEADAPCHEAVMSWVVAAAVEWRYHPEL